jgi:uncharacterized membrane protein YedE/YeeE
MTMRATVPALIAGVLFGAGLAVSDMVNPARVLGFLDLFGAWDPTLVFVMAAAVLASGLGYMISRRLSRPLFGSDFRIPQNRLLDSQLIGGAALFGIGWGLAGFCPGPAIAGMIYGLWQPWLFVGSMVAGMLLERTYAVARDKRRALAV